MSSAQLSDPTPTFGVPGSCAADACSSRCQQHHLQLQQQYLAAAAVPQHQSSYTSLPLHRQDQLQPPPARYASNTSNLACLAGAGTPQLMQRTHPRRPGKHAAADEAICTCVLPRTSILCRLLVVLILLVVFIQAVSCGMFFCVTLPMGHRPSYVDYRDLVTDLNAPTSAGGQPATLMQQQEQPLKAVPKLIPRVIHQTFRSRRLPASAKAFMRTWAELNGDSWQVRFYSDDAALSFVRREFPEYFEAYLNLPKNVERADFFRYMVVLRLGGVYADIDTECRQPLDSMLQPADTLLVGWDTELSDGDSAAAAGLTRQRLIANWFFAAAPGHPVLRELCDHIARNAMNTFSNNGVRDTAERTGQGIWTDLVLQHALQHHPDKRGDPWQVRILPRVAFGVRPAGASTDLPADTPGVMVLHHFMASWQMQRHRRMLQVLGPLLPWTIRPSVNPGPPEPVLSSNVTHYPVSISFSPPFTMMTDLVGWGDLQAASDVSAVVTAHGTWQPGLEPYRKPAVVEALVGALSRHSRHSTNSPVPSRMPAEPTAAAAAQPGTHGQSAPARPEGTQTGTRADAGRPSKPAVATAARSSPSAAASEHSADAPISGSSSSAAAAAMADASPGFMQGGVLVDVGAGHGFFSLAAAARGHRVIAFEASRGSLAAFRSSIAYNGFHELITVHDTLLGSDMGDVCLRYADEAGNALSKDTASIRHEQDPSAAAAQQHNATHGGSSISRPGQLPASVVAGAKASSSNNNSSMQLEQEAALAEALLRRRRGYPWLSDGQLLGHRSTQCAFHARRLQLSNVLANATDVAALRISTHGHEGWVLQGALDYLRTVHRPDVIYVEYWPAAMQAAGYRQPAKLLQQLHDLGYSDIAHAGRFCDQRWHNATHSLRLQGSFSPAARMALQQPTWCKLRPEHFDMLAGMPDAGVPENVLFLLDQHSSPSQDVQASKGSSSSSSGNSSTAIGKVGSSMHSSVGSQGSSSSSDAVGGHSHILEQVRILAPPPAPALHKPKQAPTSPSSSSNSGAIISSAHDRAGQ